MDGGITNFLLTQGVLGVAVLILSGVIYAMWRHILTLQERIIQAKDQHLIDVREIEKSHVAVEQQTANALTLMNEKIKVGKGGE